MEYIKVTSENIEKEHICCAISDNNDIQVASKKAWLSERFEDGYMYIDCLWVAGSFKGHGYSTDLLNACIEDSKSKGKKGLCILAASKKKPFLAEPKFLKYKGFRVCDEADNGIQLWYLPFREDVELPKFKECAKKPFICRVKKKLKMLLHQLQHMHCFWMGTILQTNR